MSRNPLSIIRRERAVLRRTAAAVAAAAMCAPAGALARPTGPTTDLVLTGKIRDFSSAHPDFCKTPSVGTWVEGSVAPTLSAQGKPVYTGGGRQVAAGARDAANHVISNSLIQQTVLLPPQGVKLVTPATTSDSPTVDSYNPVIGPYGGSNVGPAPAFATGQTMPVVTVPNITPYIAAPVYSGSATVSSSFRCGAFVLHQDHLTIQGDVTIVVNGIFDVGNSSSIELAPGARLTLYLLGSAVLMNQSTINSNTQAYDRVIIYKLGTSDFVTQNHTYMAATIIAPSAIFSQSNNSDVFGRVTAKSMSLQKPMSLHVAEPAQTSCSIVNDTQPVLGAMDAGKVTSAGTFDQWFNDAPGTNMETQSRLLFQKAPGGAYEFSSNDFRPIDGKLLGAGETTPNRNFTYEMDGEFVYQPCSGQFFQFTGDGDALVYVDGKLVMELIGAPAGVTQYVDMGRLALDPNQMHRLQFFYASRSCDASHFNVRTNIELQTKYTVEFETVALRD